MWFDDFMIEIDMTSPHEWRAGFLMTIGVHEVPNKPPKRGTNPCCRTPKNDFVGVKGAVKGGIRRYVGSSFGA